LALGAVIICSGLFIGMVSLKYKSSLKKKQNNGSV
jgi:hypothetical protein